MTPLIDAVATAGVMPARDWSLTSRRVGALGDRHVGLLLFIVISLGVSMALSQYYNFDVGSLQYYLLIFPAAVLPMFDVGAVVETLLGRGRILLAFLLIAGTWFLLRGDLRAVLQLGLMIWMLAWISTTRARFAVADLVGVYFAFVVVGIVVYALTDFNGWGILPGTTVGRYGDWRVSFFPNIANTGILSLAMFFVLTKDLRTARSHPIALGVVSYFLVFSFVRTALIGAVLYVVLRVWFARRRGLTERRLFWTAIIVGVGVNLLMAGSAVSLIADLQGYPIVSRLLLQSAVRDLTPDQILIQMYRPWLWGQHLSLFASSPWLMGWGAFDFEKIRPLDQVVNLVSAGSESLPTRLLASYGVPAFCFIGYFVSCLRDRARKADVWAVACFPSMVVLMMNWGSVFHPTSPLFVLLVLIAIRGSPAFRLAPKGSKRAVLQGASEDPGRRAEEAGNAVTPTPTERRE